MVVQVNRRWLELAVGNLVAQRPPARGGRREGRGRRSPTALLRVVVRDDGPGFPDDFAAARLRPVQPGRAEPDHPRLGPRAGPGAAVARAHGGEARIERSGVGASVRISVPAGPR